MKKKVSLIFGIIAFACVLLFFSVKNHSTQDFWQINLSKEESILPEYTEQEKVNYSEINFENGDLIFRRGVGLDSRAIIALDKNGFSHAGIIQIKDSEVVIIHASFGEEGQTEEVVISEPIERFLKASSSSAAAVYRFNGQNKSVPIFALAEAESFLEKKIPFDKDYNLDNADKIYCTELIWRAYKKAGIDLTGGNFDRIPYLYNDPDKKFILPSSLLNSSQLKKVRTLQ